MNSKTPQSTANLAVPSTPAAPRGLRVRSPQQPSPGFVFTGSDSRRRITREISRSSPRSRRTTTTSDAEQSPVLTAPASNKRARNDSDTPEANQIVSKKKNKVKKTNVSFFSCHSIFSVSDLACWCVGDQKSRQNNTGSC